jgi:hypothetical protein
MMQAARVSSREQVPIKASMKKGALTDLNRQIAEAIPYWPVTINQLDLARRFGMTVKKIRYRIDVAQDEYLIFEEDRELSRLKRDFSNVDERIDE